MLMRRVFPKSYRRTRRLGQAAVGSNEVRGKTLGIVGYGNIGSQLAVLAEAIGMRVIYHDHTESCAHGNVEPAEPRRSAGQGRRRDPARAGDAGTQGMIGRRGSRG